MLELKTHAKVKFLTKVLVTHAKPDGGRWKETIKAGEIRIVPRASANWRHGQGQISILELCDDPDPKPKGLPVLSVNELQLPITTESDVVVDEPIDISIELGKMRDAIMRLDLDGVKKSFGNISLREFSDYVDERDITSDSKLVISASIEEFQQTKDLSTISLSDLKDSIVELLNSDSE